MFMRYMLKKLRSSLKFKTKGTNQNGVVLIPETGAPCTDFIYPSRNARKVFEVNKWWSYPFFKEFDEITSQLVLEVYTIINIFLRFLFRTLRAEWSV